MKNLRYLVPNLVTMAALCCGVLAIDRVMSGDLMAASWWILTGTVLDGIDGATARLLKAQSKIGSQMDSFADFATFGVAPPVLLVAALRPVASEAMVIVAGLWFTIAAALRLSQFNLAEARDTFHGMPSPMAAGVFTLILHLVLKYGADLETAAVPLCLGLVVFGAAMLSPWLQYRKLGREHSRMLKWIVAGLVLICYVCILARRLPEFLLGVSGSAAVVGPVLSRVDRPRPVPAAKPLDNSD
ncbi:MAG: CDP-alcohol phosphatidyltransferase family protein [Bradymonadales bacterium]|nr:CDP-alcohol phosphatidyltransferase family protein [Bradymonadales bacterium]